MNSCLTIVKKELLELFRDRSTFCVLLIPILIFPLFNFGIDYMNQNSKSEIRVCIQCDDFELYGSFTEYASLNDNYSINIIDSDDPTELLLNGDIDCIIRSVGHDLDFIYNSASYDSLSLTTKLGEGFQQFYNTVLCQAYDNVYSFNLKDENNNVSDTVTSISNIFLPILLIIFIFQNTSSFANDIFAGEKERQTLELLLLSNIKRTHIYFGKSLALLTVSVINLMLTLASFFISSEAKQFKFMQSEFPGLYILHIVSTMLFLSVIAVFLSLTVSILSNNMKNSQLLNELLLTIPVGLAVLLSFGIIKANTFAFNFIPILNLIISFCNAFAGKLNTANILISVIINLLFIAMLILVGVKHINTEKVLK